MLTVGYIAMLRLGQYYQDWSSIPLERKERKQKGNSWQFPENCLKGNKGEGEGKGKGKGKGKGSGSRKERKKEERKIKKKEIVILAMCQELRGVVIFI